MLRRLYSHLVWLIFPWWVRNTECIVDRPTAVDRHTVEPLFIGILHIPNRERFKTLGILSTFNLNTT